jgi:ABC-type antimicrobial peptide transport system permease subunit
MPRVSKNAVLGFQINVTLGKSFLGRAAKAAPITRRIKLVGFSEQAITVGVTFPLAYVKRFNTRFSGKQAGTTYHSVIMSVADQRDVGRVVDAIKAAGFDLAQSTKNAEQAANIIRTVESVFALISMVIVGIAAVNISQLFFMLVSQRRREIGLYRALGASRSDIRLMFLGEASIIGLFGGLVGALTGYMTSIGVDWLSTKLPEFPYKPETFFAFPSWLWMVAILISILFCLAGAFFPASAAARQEPAAALTE